MEFNQYGLIERPKEIKIETLESEKREETDPEKNEKTLIDISVQNKDIKKTIPASFKNLLEKGEQHYYDSYEQSTPPRPNSTTNITNIETANASMRNNPVDSINEAKIQKDQQELTNEPSLRKLNEDITFIKSLAKQEKAELCFREIRKRYTYKNIRKLQPKSMETKLRENMQRVHRDIRIYNLLKD